MVYRTTHKHEIYLFRGQNGWPSNNLKEQKTALRITDHFRDDLGSVARPTFKPFSSLVIPDEGAVLSSLSRTFMRDHCPQAAGPT
jgi:hypothetical protein